MKGLVETPIDTASKTQGEPSGDNNPTPIQATVGDDRWWEIVTPTGAVVALVGVAMVGVGAATGWREATVIGAGGLAAFLVALVFVARRPRLLLNRSITPERVTAGEPAFALLTAINTTHRSAPPFMVGDGMGAMTLRVPVPPIPAGEARRVHYSIPTGRRGRLLLGPVTLTRVDPLGLLRRRQDHGHRQLLWVHPRSYPVPPMPSGIVMDMEGPLTEAAPKGTITFSGLREYVLGDDLRQVHWPSTARTGTLIVREHVDTSQPRTTVVLDARGGLWTPDAFEAGVELAASVITASESRGHPIDLLVAGAADHEGGLSPASLSGLDRLAGAEQGPPAPIGVLMATVERAVPGGALVLVTGSTSADFLPRVAGQRRRFAPVVVARAVDCLAAKAHRHRGLLLIEGSSGADLAHLWTMTVRRVRA